MKGGASTRRSSAGRATRQRARNPWYTAERALGQLVEELDYTDIVDVFCSGLHDFLDAIRDKRNGVGDRITHTFFAQRRQGESLR